MDDEVDDFLKRNLRALEFDLRLRKALDVLNSTDLNALLIGEAERLERAGMGFQPITFDADG